MYRDVFLFYPFSDVGVLSKHDMSMTSQDSHRLLGFLERYQEEIEGALRSKLMDDGICQWRNECTCLLHAVCDHAKYRSNLIHIGVLFPE